MGAALPVQVASGRDRAEQVRRSVASSIGEFKALRRDLHQHPELSFQEFRTAAIVAERLAQWGYEVTTGIAGTGVVGTLRRGRGECRLGIRADMDALPIQEATGLPYASVAKGVMHACGHDGHTAILLAAAKSIGVDNDYGSLAAGRYGNVILADKELNLKAVIQKGVRIV